MMFSEVDYLTLQERYEDMRREAEGERQLRVAFPRPPHRNPARRLAARVLQGAGQAALRMSDALGPQVDYPTGYGAVG